MLDFQPAHDARLRPEDLRKLAGVSRCTASLWLNGHSQPHRLHLDGVRETLDLIAKATKAGLLPVPHNVTRRERGHYIQGVIEQVSAS